MDTPTATLTEQDKIALQQFLGDAEKVKRFLHDTSAGINVRDWNSRVWHALYADALAEVQRLRHENEMQKITINMLDITTSDQLEIIEKHRALLKKVANEAHMSRIETGFTDETWNEMKKHGD